MIVAVAVLIAAYGAVVVFSQPHVDGEELSLTSFVDLVIDGRVSDAEILDVDSFVVGTYQADDGTARSYNTPYLKETRERLVDLLVESRVPATIDQQNGKRAVALASILLPGLILTVLVIYRSFQALDAEHRRLGRRVLAKLDRYAAVFVVEHCDELQSSSERCEVQPQGRDADIICMFELRHGSLCDLQTTRKLCLAHGLNMTKLVEAELFERQLPGPCDRLL